LAPLATEMAKVWRAERRLRLSWRRGRGWGRAYLL